MHHYLASAVLVMSYFDIVFCCNQSPAIFNCILMAYTLVTRWRRWRYKFMINYNIISVHRSLCIFKDRITFLQTLKPLLHCMFSNKLLFSIVCFCRTCYWVSEETQNNANYLISAYQDRNLKHIITRMKWLLLISKITNQVPT